MRSHRSISRALVVVGLASIGCARRAAPQPATDAASSASSAATPAPSSDAGEAIGPVYPRDAGPTDPLAERLCVALHELPSSRASACCQGAGSIGATLLSKECSRMLGFALGDRAVRLEPSAVEACEAAMQRETAGCDWVLPLGTPLPQACRALVSGVRGEGARCRSSLECVAGLHCEGLSAIDLGTCAKPKPVGAACALAIDPLAADVRDATLPEAHAECEGRCVGHRCEGAVALGGKCASDGDCGRARCVGGVCSDAALPSAGARCTDRCSGSARCVKGTCTMPKREGESCELDAECRGACVAGGGHHRCLASCGGGR